MQKAYDAQVYRGHNRLGKPTRVLSRLLTLLWVLLLCVHSTTYAHAATSVRRGGAQLGSLQAEAQSFAPLLDVVPSEDGRELLISAGGIGQVGGALFANIELGPGHRKGSYTAPYSETAEAYVVTVPGFTPQVDTSAPIYITTTTGLETEPVEFVRAYVPVGSTPTINTADGNLQLTFVHSDTVPGDTYLALTPSYAPPAPLPPGYQLVGSAYNLRASGALAAGEQPMSLHMSYNTFSMGGADPHQLGIFVWNPGAHRWEQLSSALFSTQHYLAAATTRFGYYALIATATWADNFSDFSGLDSNQLTNVTFGGAPGRRTVVLNGTSTQGSAVTQPITAPALTQSWDTLIYTASVTPSQTAVTVDVLDADGTLLLSNVTSGASLAAINLGEYPALRLRATLHTKVKGTTPALVGWQVSWQARVEEAVPPQLHLPLLLNQEGVNRESGG